jgi:drug/metabolite transporter (DMT)-like permease
MLALLGGLGGAAAFATATLCSSRSSRMIGAAPVLGWVMLVGFAVVAPATAAAGVPSELDAHSVGWLTLSGCGNVFGLLLLYAALRIGKVGVVAPIASTEGAVAAVIAVAAGESLGRSTAAALAVATVGVVLASAQEERAGPPRAALLAAGAAAAFGGSIYATGRVSEQLPLVWAVLPPRAAGVLVVTVPLAATGRLRLTRRVLPLVAASALCEVGGFFSYAIGARHGIAISAVAVSQFAAIAAVAAYFLFRERLTAVQLSGVALIVAGVATVAALQT